MKPLRTPVAAAAILAMTIQQKPMPQPTATPSPEQGNAALAAMATALAAVDAVAVTEAGDLDDAPPEADAVSAARRHAVALGARIRAAREINGMAQGDFAKAIGHKNPTQPSLWEAGRRPVPTHEIATVARVLAVSTDFLHGLTDDPDADPAQSRRNALVQHLRDQLEAVAGGLADAALEGGAEVEAALRTTRLMTRCETVRVAFERFKAANEAQFDELRGGAWVVRATHELMEAAATVGAELEGVAERRARAAIRARQAMQGAAIDSEKPASEGAQRAAQ